MRSNFKIIVLVFFFSCCHFLHSHANGKIDSLRLALAVSKEDTNKVNILLEICSQDGFIEDKECLRYAQEALSLAKKLTFTAGQIKAYIHLGESYSGMGEYDQALFNIKKGFTLCEQINERGSLFSKLTICIAGIHYYKGDYDKALNLFLKTISALEKAGQKREKAKVLSSIAIIYFQTNKQIESKKSALESNKLFEEIRDTVNLSKSLNLLGSIFYNEEDYSNALLYYKKSMQYAEKIKSTNSLNANLCGIGIVLADTKKYEEAIGYFSKALDLSKALNDKGAITTILLNMGICYTGLSKYNDATKIFEDALRISNEIGRKYTTKEIYHFMMENYEKKGDYKKALVSLQKFILVNDSLYNEGSNAQINELTIKYESEKKEKEILALNNTVLSKEKDTELLHFEVQKRNSIIVGIILGSILLFITLVLLFNRRRLIQQHKYQIELNLQREKTTKDIIQALETEQNRIAKDLHDGVGTILSTLKINLFNFEKSVETNKREAYQDTVKLIDKISIELRNVMYNLSSETLLEHGLVVTFSELVNRINKLNLTHFDFQATGLNKRLDGVVELSLYRIGQELVTNCIKHAGAKTATLQLITNDENITLMLEDDGVGFKVPDDNLKESASNGMGLKNIKDRVTFIKGVINFESSSQNGTICIVQIPIIK